MNRPKIIAEFKKMPRQEQLALLKTLTSIVETEKPSTERKRTLDTLYGALREEGKPAPTDEEVKKMYVDYLVEKYS